MSENECSAKYAGGIFCLRNSRIERGWRVTPGSLEPLYIRDLSSGTVWGDIPTQDVAPGSFPAGATLREEAAEFIGGAIPGRRFVLTLAEGEEHEFHLMPGVSALIQRHRPARTDDVRSADAMDVAALADGVEVEPGSVSRKVAAPDADYADMVYPCVNNLLLRHYALCDQTDINDNLCQCAEYRLAHTGRLEFTGCVLALENPLTEAGLIFLKHAPLPHARPLCDAADFVYENNRLRVLRTAGGYPAAVIVYAGGEGGMRAALQGYQRALRPYRPGRDGVLISNTWGDRSRDAALCTEFLCAEIDAAADLGVEVVQIDDGWQKGTTSNSVNAQAAGGVWEGFYAKDPEFWRVNPQRFAQGLDAVFAHARERGVGIGLWFAPDSAQEFANWRRDVEAVCGFYRDWGVRHVKIDGVKAHSPAGERNLHAFFAGVARETDNAVHFDLDVTAEIRPGYFGAPQSGCIFVENRYTDWQNYWPHATFRNLWQLAHLLPPSLLRMEWLNPLRNRENYAGDPLAPAALDPAYVFASIMLSSPLFWCELSRLEDSVNGRLKPLLELWRKYRPELHGGVVHPVGQAPCGGGWSGFLVASQDGGARSAHLLLFREYTDQAERYIELPQSLVGYAGMERLAGQGEVALARERVAVARLPERHSFGWWRFS